MTLDKIKRRRTLRTGRLAKTLSAEDTGKLPKEFHFFSPSPLEGHYLAECTIEANRAQAQRDAVQQELANWIRFPDSGARGHRDGLTPESMEIKGLAGWYARHFMRCAHVMTQSFKDQGNDQVRAEVASYGDWIVVTSAGSTPASLIEPGRLTERMWLSARERMIAVHPMTQMLEEPTFNLNVAKTLGPTGTRAIPIARRIRRALARTCKLAPPGGGDASGQNRHPHGRLVAYSLCGPED